MQQNLVAREERQPELGRVDEEVSHPLLALSPSNKDSELQAPITRSREEEEAGV